MGGEEPEIERRWLAGLVPGGMVGEMGEGLGVLVRDTEWNT